MANTLGEATVVVLAAGEGKRMKSETPKVLHPVLGEPMLGLVLSALEQAGTGRRILVLGHKADVVRAWVGTRAETVLQPQQLGTGHAVMMAVPHLPEAPDSEVIVTCGDTPLVTPETFRALAERHRAEGNTATVLTAVLDDAKAYGRIVRAADGSVRGIVEFRDATPEQRAIREINSGIYCFAAGPLREALGSLKNNNAQGEYYLTDVLSWCVARGLRVGALVAESWSELVGVNSPEELAEAEELLARRVRRRHFANGVAIESPGTVRIGPFVEIGKGSRIRPGTILEGHCRIGEGCTVGPNVRAVNAALPAGSVFDAAGIVVPPA